MKEKFHRKIHMIWWNTHFHASGVYQKKKTNINKGQLKKFLFLVMAVTLDEEQGC